MLLRPLDKCADYKPKPGTEERDGVTLEQFTELYGGDPFYHWVGLDDPLMYAAHAAVIRRYKNSKMLVMTGVRGDDDTTGTYAFMKEIVGFDLAQFFERNTEAMRKRCKVVLEALLAPG